MLPDGWKSTTLGKIMDFRNGLNFSKSDSKNLIKVVGVSDFSLGNVLSRTDSLKETYVDQFKDDDLLKGNDFLFVRSNGNKSLIGRCLYFPHIPEPISFSGFTIRGRLKNRSINASYIFQIIAGEYFRKHINLSGSGTNISNLSQEILSNTPLILPPLPEQKKIAAILSTWDRAIEGTEKLLANSQQQKKALMQQLLTGKKRLPGFTGEWKTVTIGSLLKEAKRPVEWKDDNFYKLLSVKRRSEGVILREVLHGTKILTKKMNYAKSGDFLISKMQVVHGASGLVPEHLDNHHISDSYIALRAKNPEKFDIEFFSWLSKERVMYHKTFLCSYGVTIEKMTFNFNMYLKENIKIPPTVTEQRSISQLLNTTENEITALESDLSRLRQEKKALMQQLLTGKIRVAV